MTCHNQRIDRQSHLRQPNADIGLFRESHDRKPKTTPSSEKPLPGFRLMLFGSLHHDLIRDTSISARYQKIWVTQPKSEQKYDRSQNSESKLNADAKLLHETADDNSCMYPLVSEQLSSRFQSLNATASLPLIADQPPHSVPYKHV